MSNRSCTILLLFLALAGNAKTLTAQASAVQVKVYDYADLKPESLRSVVALTHEILAGAGLSVQVELCRGSLAVSCDGQSGSIRSLVVRVVPGASKTNDSVLRLPLGQSMADHQGGTYASIFMERVQDAAAEANVPRDTVLAYAIAHEIGHLLLGDNAHTPRGVMKGNWDRKDYEAMNQRQFHFIEGQAHQLASRFGGAPSAQVAVGQ
jgi:hypothetical protein